MVAFTVVGAVAMRRARTIGRVEGGLLLAASVGFLVALGLS